jgi:S-adenosylmethionine decarboxylase
VTCFQNIGASLPLRSLVAAFAARRSRSAAGSVVIITGAKVKRKHFFLALLSSCSIIQPTFAPCRVGEEEIATTASAAPNETASQFDDRRRSRSRRGGRSLESLGRHLLLELYDCSSEVLENLESVKTAMVEAARRAEATIIDVVFHEFNPFGISGVVVISESHLSIHTWPEHRYAAVDIFSCGDTLKPAEAANYLVEQFGAGRASCVEVKRGVFPGMAGLSNKVKEGVAANGTTEPLQMVF